MNCNMELHEILIESGDIVCPFCNQNLEDSDENHEIVQQNIIYAVIARISSIMMG